MNEKEIENIKKVKKEMNKQIIYFAKELAQKLNRTALSIKEEGLTIKDFYFDLKVSFVDGSKMKFKSAFFVENDVEYGVFTEHCGYYIISKGLISKIKQHN